MTLSEFRQIKITRSYVLKGSIPYRHHGTEWCLCCLCDDPVARIVTVDCESSIHKYFLCSSCYLDEYFQEKMKGWNVLKVENFKDEWK